VAAARWVPPENLHATVAFIGETPDADAVIEAVTRAASPFPPVRLVLEGLGAFPSWRRARVLWAGLTGEVAVLSAAARAVGEALAPIGYEPEDRPYTAHVTLARLRSPGPVAAASAAVGPVSFLAEGLGVYRSLLGRPAARYERLALAPFSASRA